MAVAEAHVTRGFDQQFLDQRQPRGGIGGGGALGSDPTNASAASDTPFDARSGNTTAHCNATRHGNTRGHDDPASNRHSTGNRDAEGHGLGDTSAYTYRRPDEHAEGHEYPRTHPVTTADRNPGTHTFPGPNSHPTPHRDRNASSYGLASAHKVTGPDAYTRASAHPAAPSDQRRGLASGHAIHDDAGAFESSSPAPCARLSTSPERRKPGPNHERERGSA